MQVTFQNVLNTPLTFFWKNKRIASTEETSKWRTDHEQKPFHKASLSVSFGLTAFVLAITSGLINKIRNKESKNIFAKVLALFGLVACAGGISTSTKKIIPDNVTTALAMSTGEKTEISQKPSRIKDALHKCTEKIIHVISSEKLKFLDDPQIDDLIGSTLGETGTLILQSLRILRQEVLKSLQSDPITGKKNLKQCYQVLGLPEDATLDEIKSKYRELAKKCHPDINPNNKEANELFIQLQEAYEVLTKALEEKQD